MPKRSNLKPTSGTLREDRFLKALNPATAPVDERSCEDLMAFALDFSRLVSFYDANNQPVSDWHGFFSRDLSFLLAEIVTTDFQKEHFQGWTFQNAVREGRENIKDILTAIYRMAQRLNRWYLWSTDIVRREYKDNRVRMTLESIIKMDVRDRLGKDLDDILQKLPPPLKGESWVDLWAARRERLAVGTTYLTNLWQVQKGDEHPGAVLTYDNPVDGLLAVLRALHLANHKLHNVAKKYLDEFLTSHSDHPPHTALYISFIKLLVPLRDKINTIPSRHLDFYYRKVLQLRERGSFPDTAHVCFDLAPEIKSYTLPAGTILTAGKDPGGKPIEYAMDHELFINQARIASLRALYLAQDDSSLTPEMKERITGIFALPQADSEDGKGAPLKIPQQGWPTFGINEATNDGLDVSPLHAELGFVVASPVLLLQEGERNVVVTVAFAGDGKLEEALQKYQRAANEILDAAPAMEYLLADAFLVYVSGEKGWMPVTNASFRRHAVVGTTLEVEFTFRPLDPAILPNPLLAPARDGGSEWPLFKLVLNPHARVYAYPFFSPLDIETVEIRVSVHGVQKLQLRNEIGPVDPAQPFPVLGAVPSQGSYLLVNHRELNVKPVEQATLSFTWFNLPKPPENLESYYAGYGLGIRDDSFKLRISVFGKERWEPPADGHELFPMFARDYDRSGGLLPVTVIAAQIPEIPLPLVERPAPPVISETDAPRGAIRLELAEPAIGFGHQVFPSIMAETALKIAKAGKNGPPQPLPNQPLAPVAKAVTLDYDAGDKLVLTRPLPENQKSHFYSLHPFGYLSHRGRTTPMLPGFQEQGHLFLGINNAGPRQPVSLLFQICDTAFSPVPGLRDHHHDAVLPMRWRYLSGHEWKDLPAWMLLSDSTMGLTRSGIVKLSLPEDISAETSLMPGGMIWIEAAMPRVRDFYWSRVVSINTQAVRATRVCDPHNPLLPAVVPAGSITQLKQKLGPVKAVRQPFATSDGRSRENETEFRTRVSERLRHKDRAIQGVDFERLILSEFPEVGQVKCVGPNNSRYFPDALPVEPGSLYLVVAPRLEDTPEREPRLPQYMLKRIQDYIESHTSAFVRDIHVINPVYETLKVFAKVEFSLEGDSAGYVDQLDALLSARLQLWRDKPIKPMPIGSGQVQSYEISLFIQQQPYVERLHELRMLHTFRTARGYVSRWLSSEQRASASAPWSVLLPGAHHSITAVYGEQAAGQDYAIAPGISNLTVGGDFAMIQDKKEKKEDAPELRYFLVVPAHH